MVRPRLLHLFNAFQVGGVERQHMMLVERLTTAFDQICWAYIEGQLEEEMDRIGVSHVVGNSEEMLEVARRSHCIIMRTNRYFRQWATPLAELEVPVLYIRDYLSWYQGNGTYHDRKLDQQAYALADYTMFCGPELKNAAKGMDFKGGEFLYNTLDLNRFSMHPRSGPVNSPIRVAMLGNIVPRKNNVAVIHAMREMFEAGECSLHIGGDLRHDEYVDEVRTAAQGLPVTLYGHINDPAMFLVDKDIFLMASTKEGWPVSIMEAMACGLPIVSTDIGDIATLLDHGRSGILVEDATGVPAALKRLNSRKTYATFSRRGVKWIKSYSIDNAARQVSGAIMDLLKKETSL